MTGGIRHAVVDLLLDHDPLRSDFTVLPWRLVRKGDRDYSAGELLIARSATADEVRVALRLAEVKQRHLARAAELLGPYEMAGDEDAWDALGRMPAGPERDEAEALIGRYPAELAGGDADEVLVDLRHSGGGG